MLLKQGGFVCDDKCKHGSTVSAIMHLKGRGHIGVPQRYCR